jgi:hypothetical protein
MNYRAIVLSLFALLMSSTMLASTVMAAGSKPDLVITHFGLKSWGTCSTGQTVFTFSVTVKNQGNGTWPTSQNPALLVKDLHFGIPVPDGWSVGIGLNPPLKPGESKTILVPISYYDADPAHMTTQAPHPFMAIVNRKKVDGTYVVEESNYANNAGPGPADWKGTKVILVDGPKGCAKKVKVPSLPAPRP